MKKDEQIYTYFVQAENGGLIKIGKTTNPKKRINKMQGQCPIKLKYLYIIKNDFESILHEQFNEFKVHHEWYNPSMIIPFINDLKNGKIILAEDKKEAEMRISMKEHIYKEPETQKIEYNNINEYLDDYEEMLIEDL